MKFWSWRKACVEFDNFYKFVAALTTRFYILKRQRCLPYYTDGPYYPLSSIRLMHPQSDAILKADIPGKFLKPSTKMLIFETQQGFQEINSCSRVNTKQVLWLSVMLSKLVWPQIRVALCSRFMVFVFINFSLLISHFPVLPQSDIQPNALLTLWSGKTIRSCINISFLNSQRLYQFFAVRATVVCLKCLPIRYSTNLRFQTCGIVGNAETLPRRKGSGEDIQTTPANNLP